MLNERKFYIDGRWQDPSSSALLDVINPATAKVHTRIAAGNAADIDKAVKAARNAFDSFSVSSKEERIELLKKILAGFEQRVDDLSEAMSIEMGVPLKAAKDIHFPSGPGHIREAIRVLQDFEPDALNGTTMVTKEPIGVCGLITPWNFPINQVVCKAASALAAGCTMVLKPSEVSPLSALIIAEIMHDAGTPKGVFNLVNGDGANAGSALVAHPDVDMISFTGSTRAGVQISKAAADTVKRVSLELGGKSANILLPDVDLERAVTLGVQRCFNNSGQSCISPTRMLVHESQLEQAVQFAGNVARSIRVGMPADPQTVLGPVANGAQFDKVRSYIRSGIDAGARLVAGGLDLPDGLDQGYFVRPTIFADVTENMAIANEEIFGPVLCIMTYSDIDDAVRLANATPYGLAAYVQSADITKARQVARRLRAGIVQINYPAVDRSAPFGGYKQSGNGREWGEHGLHEYLEVKSIVGHGNDQ
ncbi:aldehyde dehydrogenase family protein [Parapusillimonas sp. SGNA-6]|nr:aldehyde dehydrogenase family protein [Parapusillimonas sp. SGNA-6]